MGIKERRDEMERLIRCTTGAYDFIGGGTDTKLTEAATEWVDEGFGDDADAWWDAGCFDAGSAASLRDAGLSPDDVSGICPRFGGGNSWGYAYSNSNVSLDDVIAACKD